MQKLLIGMAIAGCFDQASDGQGGQHNPARTGGDAKRPGGITATFLEHHFSETDGAQQTKLVVLVNSLKTTTQKEVNDAVRDWSNAYKPTAQKGTPEFRAQTARRQVIQTRGGEVKTLKAALDTGFTPEQGKGYHPTIASARATLAQKGLSNIGKPVVDPKERAQNRKASLIAQEMVKAANKGGDKSPETLLERLQNVGAEAEQRVKQDTARKLGNVIIQRHGLEIAMMVAEYLQTEAQKIAQQAANAQADQSEENGEQPTSLTEEQQAAKDAQNQQPEIPQQAQAA